MSKIKSPEILVDVYGKKPPRAAEFGKGVQTIAEIKQAAEAQKTVKPGDYCKGGAQDDPE